MTETYSYLLVASLLGLFAPLLLALVSGAIRRRATSTLGNPELDGAHVRERERVQSSLGGRLNTRIYIGVNLAIVFFGVVLLLLPWVFAIQSRDLRVFGLIFTLTTLLAVCIWYSARSGDLDWSTELDAEIESETGG